MSHRGRLNVLANMMQKPFKAIFKEFFGEKINSKKDFEGDVKYHLGLLPIESSTATLFILV